MFINQKAQQISFALIKISVQVRRMDLRSRLERLAFDLLETVAAEDLEMAAKNAEVIRELITFGKSIYQIEPINAKIISQELDVLNSAIQQIIGIGLENGDLSTVFSQPPVVSVPEPENLYNNHDGNHDSQVPSNGNGNGINSTIRQSAIIDKIRQSGKIALKDLLTAFPDVSERTLRYDLQKLCNQGVLERIGNGGPATYYVAKA